MNVKNKGGRPRTIESPEAFEAMAEAYFKGCERDGVPVTWTGLCLAVGLSSRQSMETYKSGEYDTEEVKFSDSCKKALARVELEYEKRLIIDGGSGPIFALKNFGWRDRQEHDVMSSDGSMTPKGTTVINADMDESEAAKIFSEMVKGG